MEIGFYGLQEAVFLSVSAWKIQFYIPFMTVALPLLQNKYQAAKNQNYITIMHKDIKLRCTPAGF